MNALELADYLDSDEGLTNTCTEAAAMLRRQYEYVKTLREALEHSVKYVPELADVPGIKAALKPGVELTHEQWLAVREGHFNAAASEYFGARPNMDTAHTRRIFYAGHCKGYGAAPPAQTPVPPRLTDEQYFEIGQRHWLSSTKVAEIHKEIETALRSKPGAPNA
jgi:hypothetical protein